MNLTDCFFLSCSDREPWVCPLGVSTACSDDVHFSFAVPTRFVFKSAFLWDVVLTTTETWLFRLGRYLRMQWLYVVYLTICGCIPESVGLLFSHFHRQRNFHAHFPCKPFFCQKPFLGLLASKATDKSVS